jgi:pimeloyl-ACP methyl ester carboxylesterase
MEYDERMRTVSVEPPADQGRLDGLAYALFLPDGPAAGGVVVLHGADSTRESHFEFARLCRTSGLAAVCFDARGHGESEGDLDGRVLGDVARIASLLPKGPVGLRGSSMGGWTAIAAGSVVGADAVVAICPATGSGLARGLRAGRFAFRADAPGLTGVLETVDLSDEAARLGAGLLLLHAEGDDVVPVEHSRALHEAAPGTRLVTVPGGHHRSAQHDPELQALSVRFLLDRFEARPSPRRPHLTPK